MAFSSALFLDSLSARPPTPPRETESAIEEALQYLDDSFATTTKPSPRRASGHLLDTTPDQSPASSAEQQENATGKTKKKVGFTGWGTTYHVSPQYNQIGRVHTSSPLRPLPSLSSSKPRKSILKAHSSPLQPIASPDIQPRKAFCATDFDTLGDMFEEAVRLLASQPREIRLEVYMGLLGTLKTFDDVPEFEFEALRQKLGLLTQFIRRDCNDFNIPNNAVDTVLASQAMKVLMVLLQIANLSDSIDNEFAISLIDRSTSIFELPDPPKGLLNHYMFLMHEQHFKPRIMTVDRAEKILAALKNIEDRVTGNGVVAHRLLIYQKFLKQARSAMIAKTSDWIEHMT